MSRAVNGSRRPVKEKNVWRLPGSVTAGRSLSALLLGYSDARKTTCCSTFTTTSLCFLLGFCSSGRGGLGFFVYKRGVGSYYYAVHIEEWHQEAHTPFFPILVLVAPSDF